MWIVLELEVVEPDFFRRSRLLSVSTLNGPPEPTIPLRDRLPGSPEGGHVVALLLETLTSILRRKAP